MGSNTHTEIALNLVVGQASIGNHSRICYPFLDAVQSCTQAAPAQGTIVIEHSDRRHLPQPGTFCPLKLDQTRDDNGHDFYLCDLGLLGSYMAMKEQVHSCLHAAHERTGERRRRCDDRGDGRQGKMLCEIMTARHFCY